MITQRAVHIGNVVRNAILFNMRNQRKSPVSTDALSRDVSRLFELLHERQIDYLLVGGIAMLHYVEGRNTEDIDLIIALSSLQELPEIDIDSQGDSFVRVGLFENDIASLIQAYQPNLPPLFEELSHHLSDSDMGELQTIVAEIQQRLVRFRRGSEPASPGD